MAMFTIHYPWVFAFGLLGNIISFMVYLSPVRTFYGVYKKKSTEGFQSFPYVIALFSAMLWIYYAFLKTDAFLLIAINSIGCVIETIYIVIYMAYATKKARVYTAKLLVFLILGAYSSIFLLTLLLTKGSNRVRVLGWVCVAFSVSVFAAPLSIMRLVIRTKSVQFMPFYLSFFLTLSAVTWFCYGLLMKDFYIALPNVLGFVFGVLQMILYVIYKDTKEVIEEMKPKEQIIDIVKLNMLASPEVNPVDAQLIHEGKAQKVHEQTEDGQENMATLKELQLSDSEV